MKAKAVFREIGEAMRLAGDPPKGDEKRDASRLRGNPAHRAGRVTKHGDNKGQLHRPNRAC